MSTHVDLPPGGSHNFPSWPIPDRTTMTIQNTSGSAGTYTVIAGAWQTNATVGANSTVQQTGYWAGVVVTCSNTSTSASLQVWTS